MDRVCSVLSIIAAALLLLGAGDAHSADFIVDSTADEIDALPGDGICAALGGGCTLRAAIIEANQLPGFDSVSIPAGTYVLTIGGAPEDDGLEGDLDVLDDLEVHGAGADLTVIDAGGAEAVIALVGDFLTAASVADLTLSGGTQYGLVAFMAGISGATISDCVVTHSAGAGIRAAGPSFVSVVRTSVVENEGWGIYSSDGMTLVVENSQVAKNELGGIVFTFGSTANEVRATVVEDNSWVGISVGDSDLVLEDSLVLRNLGTGLAFSEADLDVIRTTIEDSQDVGLYGPGNGYGSLLLSDSAVISNATGIQIPFMINASVEIENATISGNAGGSGGIAVANPYGANQLSVRSSTIVANSGTSAGGIAALDSSNLGGTEVFGSIIAGNQATSGANDCGQLDPNEPPLVLSGGNLIGNASGCTFTALGGDLIGTASTPIDPLLSPLASNGGATPTHALLLGSPALDTAAGFCLPTDQRGVARPAACDVGAYEADDFDGDGVGDLFDNCQAFANADQSDSDGDWVGDVCDNCVEIANPRLPAGYLATHPFVIVTGGQRDDDFDGFGNRCDAKFPGVLGVTVGPDDLAEYRASSGKSRSATICGSVGALPCAIFDLDETGTTIGPGDLAVYRELNAKLPGPKCTDCPIDCDAGSLRSCAP